MYDIYALDTLFISVSFLAPRWVTDSDAYPIKYVFGYLNDKGVFQPWETQTNNEYTISVPPGYGPNNILTLRVQIKDSFGSMKHMDKNITVNKLTNIDEDKVQDLMKKGSYYDSIALVQLSEPSLLPP